MRRGVVIVIAVVATAAALSTAPPAHAAVPVLHLDGRGFGHGVGLAQWGAKYAADAGATTVDILGTFYPGTDLGQAAGDVRVAVHSGGDAVLAFPQGGEVRSPLVGDQQPGFPVVVGPGGSVVVRPHGGGLRVDGLVSGQSAGRPQCLPLLGPCPPDGGNGGGNGGGGGCALGCGTPTTVPPPAEPPPPDAPPPSDAPPPPAEAPPPDAVSPGTEPPATEAISPGSVYAVPSGGGVTDVTARGRSYRGFVEALPAAGGLRLVNQLDVETYLKGMAEVPASWPAAAQGAQAIAARTYVLRAMAASGEVCDYDRCQVYVGATREAAGQSAAVDATRGTVVTYGGALAASVYSADAGGITATPFEGFGSGGGQYPYLTNVRYDTPDPLPWVVDVGLADVASRFGYPGTITGVRIAEAGSSGRAMQIALDGDAGERLVDGRSFARSLGLRSTLFTPSIGTAAVAPAAPTATAEEQMALPDDAAAMTAAVAGNGTSLGAAASSAIGVSADLAFTLRPPSPEDHPATYLAIGLLAATTAFGMARLGGAEAAAALAVSSPLRAARSWRRTHPRPHRRRGHPPATPSPR